MLRRVSVELGVDAVRAGVADLLGESLRAPINSGRWHDEAIPAGEATIGVEIEPEGEHRCSVTFESITTLKIPFFGGFFKPLLGIAQRRRLGHLATSLTALSTGSALPEPPRPVPGLPTTRFNQEQADLLSTASFGAMMAGFGAALFGQHADFVADSFGSTDAALGISLAVTRVGVIVALFATALADRRGRRLLLLISVAGVAVSNIGGALAPNLAIFTAFQMGTRGFVNSTFAVAGVAAIEEAPEGARGFSTAMLAMAGGLGFSIAVLTLPVSDLGEQTWRASFLLSGASLLMLPRLARLLPESRRYVKLEQAGVTRGDLRELVGPVLLRRLVLFCSLGFVVNVFNAPSSQLMNRFLADERGFSGADIALFRGATTALPGLIGMLLAMRLVETRGRRPVGGVGALLGYAIQIVFFIVSGAFMWIASGGSLFFAALGSVALAALSAEVFPTEVRASANAVLTVVSVLGSAVGLIAAGLLSDPLDDLGLAIAVLGVPAMIAIVVIVPLLPESAGRRLDDVAPPRVPLPPD